MKKLMKLIVFCIFSGLIAGFIPPMASAQGEAGEVPVLLIKIRNIDQLLNDVERLILMTPGSKEAQQFGMVRGMLQGTDWIDPERSSVVGLFWTGMTPSFVAMIPFRTVNAGFQSTFNAIEGTDYYMMPIPPLPPQQQATVSLAVEQSLVNASQSATTASLVIEAEARVLLAMVEPRINAMLTTIENTPQPETGKSDMSPHDVQEMVSGMLKTFQQVEILRMGLDIDGDILTMQYDLEALPGTFLAGVFVDVGGDSRLADYQVDMPVRFRSRAHNVAGMMEMEMSYMGQMYRQLGIDIDEMSAMAQSSTGEMAGGLKISSEGLAYEMVSIFQPGVDGETYTSNTYSTLFESFNQVISDLIAKETGREVGPLFEETAGSVVAGVNVKGLKLNLASVIPPEKLNGNPFADMAFEMRMAALGDMSFLASDDAAMENLINSVSGLAGSPAAGATTQVDIDLGAIVEDIKSLLPPEVPSFPIADDLGEVIVSTTLGDGIMTSRASFNVAKLIKLITTIEAIKSQNQQKTIAEGPSVYK